jgi:hypothetical protein
MQRQLMLGLFAFLFVLLGCLAGANQAQAQEYWVYYKTAQVSSETAGAGGAVSTAL